MLIQNVEKQTGMDRATIRFYEKEGFIIPVRTENGYRSYTNEDIQLLLKIKLLRQLGVSLYKIKTLQQGSGNFSQVLKEQIEILEQQIQEDTRAKFVCAQMQQDLVAFATMDSQRYLSMLSEPVSDANEVFSESVHRECHPWRRYFARGLDYQIVFTCLQLLVVVILRIRPIPSGILGYVSNFFAIPVIAAMLHYFGTTPGKWVMGIRVENINGGKLSAGEALYREGRIIWHGMGLFVPILSQWRLYRSYKDDTDGKAQLWNNDTEIIFTPWTAKKKIVAIVLWGVCLALSLLAAFDTVMPSYRGNNLTMSKFVKNYCDYEELFEADNTMILGYDGTWMKRTNTDVVIFQIGDGSHERKDFTYTFNDEGGIQSISYQDTWDDIGFMPIIPDYCRIALYTVVASRPQSKVSDLQMVDERLDNAFGVILQSGGVKTGQFQICDVTFVWKAELPEGDYWYYDGMIFRAVSKSDPEFGSEQQPIPYSLHFQITIG